MRHVETDDLAAMHVLSCDSDWRPLVESIDGVEVPKRRTIGKPKNAAIKLSPHADVVAARALVVGVGVENAMAAAQLGIGPIWALTDPWGIMAFPALPFIRQLTVLGERNDDVDAYKIIRRRYRAAGIRISYILPKEGCKNATEQLGASI
jgi:hypothetical protein